MGAGASSTSDGDAYLTMEEVKVIAGDQWDEVKWNDATKDEQGRVKCADVVALAAVKENPATETIAQPTSEKQQVGTQWKDAFGVIGLLSVKDFSEALAVVSKDAQAQVKEESRAHFFSIFGTPTAMPSEGIEPPPTSLTNNKLAWLALFENHNAYHDGEHEDRTAKTLTPALPTIMLTGEMTDWMGGFRGVLQILENASNAPSEGMFTAYTTAKAKTPEGASEIMELIRGKASTSAATEGSKFLRAAIFPTGGDIPPQFQDDVTLRFVEQWASMADWEAHKSSEFFTSATAKIKELSAEFVIIEYGGDKATHYAKV